MAKVYPCEFCGKDTDGSDKQGVWTQPDEECFWVCNNCAEQLEIDYNLSEKEKEMRRLSASEALYGFCAWVTTREARTVMSRKDDPSVVADLIHRFCKTNELPPPRKGWEKTFKHPKDND